MADRQERGPPYFYGNIKVERAVPSAFNYVVIEEACLRSAVAKSMADRTSMSSLRHELKAECSRIAARFHLKLQY